MQALYDRPSIVEGIGKKLGGSTATTFEEFCEQVRRIRAKAMTNQDMHNENNR